MQQIPMTVRGAQLLREELDYLKNERRPEIIKAIAEAREHGDLKENAEYHAAREQQGFCEGRIQEIEGKLGNSQIIDVTKIRNYRSRICLNPLKRIIKRQFLTAFFHVYFLGYLRGS